MQLEGEAVELKAAKRKAEAQAVRFQREAEEREKEVAEKTRMVVDMQVQLGRGL